MQPVYEGDPDVTMPKECYQDNENQAQETIFSVVLIISSDLANRSITSRGITIRDLAC